jgi:proline iminopeptidase
MPAVDTDTGPLWCEETGEGPALLVVHGGPGLHHRLYRSLDPLAAGCRLVFWDHRGHGRSAPLPPGDVDMALFADDAVRVADALGLDRFAVFGHSFGGWVAQELALRHPDRVDALILAATTPGQLGSTESADDDQGAPPPPEVLELLSRAPADDAELIDIYSRLAPHFLRAVDPAVITGELDPALVSADSMIRVFDALSRWSAVDRLPGLRCPTLVLAGGHDVFCSPEQLARIAARVPGAELATFEDSGHFMWLEEPDRFFPLVSGWLKRVAPAPA